jgi:hypothetical protein
MTELLPSFEALVELTTVKMKMKAALRVSLMVKECTPIIESFEQQRQRLRDEIKGGKSLESAQAELDEVSAMDVTINAEPIPVDLLEDIEISPLLLLQLSVFLDQ